MQDGGEVRASAYDALAGMDDEVDEMRDKENGIKQENDAAGDRQESREPFFQVLMS